MQDSAFSELDRLYTQILSQYPDFEALVHTLGVILVLETLLSFYCQSFEQNGAIFGTE